MLNHSLFFIILNHLTLRTILCLDAGPPSPADHLRQVFYRMDLNDRVTSILSRIFGCKQYDRDLNIKFLNLQEIVALSGAHTLGRARPERSGWGKPETKYTVYYQSFYYKRFMKYILVNPFLICCSI